MKGSPFLWTVNSAVHPFSAVPIVSLPHWRDAIMCEVSDRARVACLCALPGVPSGPAEVLLAVVARNQSGKLGLLATTAVSEYPSLTPDVPEVHMFEREIFESWGIVPSGHPWLKPVRYPLARLDGLAMPEPQVAGVIDAFKVEGEEIHEVAVGPVHAGVIEPGHFRFQCHGENVLHLEIALGYQHRGVERALAGGPHARSLMLVETLAGDTSVGHATAWCQALEALSGVPLSAKSHVLRAVALELERCANHVGDLGALAGDVGFLPTASFCGRLRGDYLNLTAELCGNRFGRGLVKAGGLGYDVSLDLAAGILARLEPLYADVLGATELLWETPSVMARFEGTGVVSRELASQLGMVGPAARASGRTRDVRWDFPTGAWVGAHGGACVRSGGDVLCRAQVRYLEIKRSHELLKNWLSNLPEGIVKPESGPLAAESVVVSMVEGWRGEIVHVLRTDRHSQIASAKLVDPSFHNWMGLAMALRDEQISDFPLCNKSFNLSYCGFDL